MTPDQLRLIAELLWYAPSAADAHQRVELIAAIHEHLTANKETRP
jgi:hypothetical protein